MDEQLKNPDEGRKSLNELLGKQNTTQEILSSISRWMEYHDGNVAFVGSFVTFDSSGEKIENVIVSHGDIDTVGELIEDIVNEVGEGSDFMSL